MLHPPDDALSFLWRFDFTRDFKGDFIIFGVSQREKDRHLSGVLVKYGWREVAAMRHAKMVRSSIRRRRHGQATEIHQIFHLNSF